MTPKAEQRERTPRSFWFDPRFAIGIVLVVASVAGVLVVVASADQTTTVYAARAVLSVGDRIGADDLVEQSVRLGTVTGKYLDADAIPSDGLIVTRTIAEGELVPSSAVGSTAGQRLASVVIAVTTQLPRSVDAGSVVDVWAAREGDSGLFGPPSVLVPSATVVQVIESDSIIAGSAAVSVELLVPRNRTARMLEALANADALSLVPVNLPMTASAKG
ncbi:SAF domain-containing protein [Homoserinimonas sp. A447]